METEKTLVRLKCQICGEEITANSEEEAMESLREHNEDAHKEENPGTRLRPWLERTD